MPKLLYVYIATNRSGTLYVGVTNNLYRRIREHIDGGTMAFPRRYRISRMVYVEATSDWRAAIAREKQIKSWSRRKKIALIESMNREWLDLLET